MQYFHYYITLGLKMQALFCIHRNVIEKVDVVNVISCHEHASRLTVLLVDLNTMSQLTKTPLSLAY